MLAFDPAKVQLKKAASVAPRPKEDGTTSSALDLSKVQLKKVAPNPTKEKEKEEPKGSSELFRVQLKKTGISFENEVGERSRSNTSAGLARPVLPPRPIPNAKPMPASLELSDGGPSILSLRFKL
jgi:hypothetical protein